MKFIALLAVLCLSLTLSACGDDATSSDEAEESTQVSNLTKPLPEPNPPSSPPSKLVIRDLREGSGPGVEKGDEIALHYVGVDIKGKEVYSNLTYNNGKPLEYTFESGAYFQGWEEGIKGMKAGGRRELWIPKRLSQEELKPLFYVIELLEVKVKAEPRSTRQPPRPDVNPPQNPPNKLVIRDLEEGSGPGVKTGDKIVVHYIGVSKSGQEVYSSYKYGRPLRYDYGSGGSSRGWEVGLIGMKTGGRRELWIPKRLSQGKRLPLFYIVDLLKIE